jgi:hypothetical protein
MTEAQDLAGSISALVPGAEFLRGGMESLAEGQRQLAEGLMALFGDSGAEGETTPPVSFADPGREIESIQFILRTADIIPAPASQREPPADPARTLWQRFLSLFRRG